MTTINWTDLFRDLPAFVAAVGLIGVTVIVFAESGLLIGFFLPGDSLLFTAGLLASRGLFDIWWLVWLAFIAAVVGDSVGYSFGYRVGRPLFDRPNSRLFKRQHLLKAEAFYHKHGGKAIILARFLPFARTFAPIVAGTAHMDYRHFLAYNVVGGALWAIGVPLAGYWLGHAIPDIDRYLLPIIVAIIAVSVAPSAWHIWRERQASRAAAAPELRGAAPAPDEAAD